MFALFLLVIAAAFVGYTVYTHFQDTPAGDGVAKRVWASVLAAGTALGAAFVHWLHGVTAP